MNKRKTSPVVMDKRKLLLPKMEFVELDTATGEGLFVKELDGKSLFEFRDRIRQIEGEPSDVQSIELIADLVLATACNEDGTPYFTKEDVDLLSNNSLVTLQALGDFAMEVSGMKGATNNLKNDLNSSSTDA